MRRDLQQMVDCEDRVRNTEGDQDQPFRRHRRVPGGRRRRGAHNVAATMSLEHGFDRIQSSLCAGGVVFLRGAAYAYPPENLPLGVLDRIPTAELDQVGIEFDTW